MESTRAYAEGRDKNNPLRELRSEFHIPAKTHYFDGNSLGLMSRDAEAHLQATIAQWRTLGIGGWLDATPPWFDLVESLGAKLAPLLGADASEITVGNSTTVNLHQLLSTFYDPTASANSILIDELAFPTDRYAVDSHLRLRGMNPRDSIIVASTTDGFVFNEDAMIDRISDEVQLVLLPSVVYTSGQLLNINRLTKAAHERNALIGFDCSHSLAIVPHELSKHGVDFAFGCTYKYAGGGPGSPGFLYVNRRHANRLPGMAGWFGNRKSTMFRMADTFDPADGAGRFQLGTPSVLALAPLLGSLTMLEKIGIHAIRSASTNMTTYLMHLIDELLVPLGCDFVRLPDNQRGGHIAILHDKAREMSLALRNLGFVPDCRPPRILRLCPSPLYSTFVECYEIIVAIQQLLKDDKLDDYSTRFDAIP